MKDLNPELFCRIHSEWNLAQRNLTDFYPFRYIGSNTIFDLYSTSCDKQIKQKCKSFLKQHPNAVIVVISDVRPDIIDIYIQSILDEVPVAGRDIPWQTATDLWNAGRLGTLPEFSFEIDRKYGKQRMERRFVSDFKIQYKKLASAWTGLLNDTESIRLALALTNLLRLLFISFVSSRYILDGRLSFVQEEATKTSLKGQSVYQDFLQPLFFETLNRPIEQRSRRALSFGNIPFLNGGLFTQTRLETENPDLSAPNTCWMKIIEVLLDKYTYNSELDESDSDKLDPMMLGHIFESLMSEQKRAITGTFYTPMPYAQMIVQNTMIHWLTENQLSESQAKSLCVQGKVDTIDMDTAAKIEQQLEKITILDPAAGSGAFLQSAHQCLFKLRSLLLQYLGKPYHPGSLAKEILVQNLYGVDIIPEANHLCELRLWLEIIHHYKIGEPIPTLPNLDVNIRCGDSLVDVSQFRHVLAIPLPQSEERQRCEQLKQAYRVSSGSEKKQLANRIDQEIRTMSEQIIEAIRNEHQSEIENSLQLPRSLFEPNPGISFVQSLPDIETLKEQHKKFDEYHSLNALAPGFSYDIHFGDIIEKGGFDIVIGNPPWFSMHRMPDESQKLLHTLYQTARPGKGVRSQSMDISAVFVEKSLQCVRHKGIVSMLVPNKLFYAPSYLRFRNYTNKNAELLEIKDISNQKAMFDASTYPASLVLKRLQPNRPSTRPSIRWPTEHIQSDNSRFSRIQLKMRDRFTIKRGICTGANHLFVGNCIESEKDISIVQFGSNESARIETTLLHPVIRGSVLKAYQYLPNEMILFTHHAAHPEVPMDIFPEHAQLWLDSHFAALQQRKNARKSHPYALCGCSTHLNSKKVVWRDISEKLEACYIRDKSCIPLNTIYYIPVEDDYTGYLLAAYLNSHLVREWCYTRAAHAQNGYRRYFAWVIEELPYLLHSPGQSQRYLTDKIVSLSRQSHTASCSERKSLQKQMDACFDRYLEQYCFSAQETAGKQRMLI